MFGDSYMTPDYRVDSIDSFWVHAAKDLDVASIKNFAEPGRSWYHIQHIMLSRDFDFTNDFFILGVPPITRYSAYKDGIGKRWNYHVFTDPFTTCEPLPLDCLDDILQVTFEQQFVNDPQGIERFNAEWNEIQHLESILLMACFLRAQDARFMIVNLSHPFVYQDLWIPGKDVITRCGRLKECVLFKDTYYSTNLDDRIKPVDFDQYGWYGHHGKEGHANWYHKVIRPKMVELQWM